MNYVIVGVPREMSKEKIIKSVAEFIKASGYSSLHFELLNEDDFVSVDYDTQKIESLVNDIVTCCVAQGTSTINVCANFWTLVAEGKITADLLDIMVDHKDATMTVLKKRKVPKLFELFLTAKNVI